MGKILCFLSEDFADFEITLACHKIRNVGKRDVLSMGYVMRLLQVNLVCSIL